ncbi:MAG: GyrI-like domain-containing protein [Demequinaceae bacterium]|nr:GyrI-like domain-containing protein [Demequinaceae bacterium]
MTPDGVPAQRIAIREVPQRGLATVRAQVQQHEVGEFLGRAFAQLFEFTNAYQGLRSRHTTTDSPTYAIYYGTFRSDAPTVVEACVVLDRLLEPGEVLPGSPEPGGAIAVRVEPAHAEAYLPITRRGLALPSLSSAYDELGAWVSRNGRIVQTIPAREVYITDVMAAGDDDHVCDVAFPFEPRR